MTLWTDIRQKARLQRAVVLPNTNGIISAWTLLDAAARLTKIAYLPVPAGDSLLDGAEAVLDIEAGVIWFNEDIPPELAVFYIAHEYAHFWLHGGRTACTTGDIEPEAAEERVPFGVDRVQGYRADCTISGKLYAKRGRLTSTCPRSYAKPLNLCSHRPEWSHG